MPPRTAETLPVGRSRLLDAAELLFAANGYDGTSVRDITRHAKVEVGLITYHFRTKADLFRETMQRRAPDFANRLHSSLDRLLSQDDPPGAEAILTAYLDTHMDLALSPDAGWRSYLRLAAEAMLRAGREELVGDVTSIYRPVMERYEQELVKLAPLIDEARTREVWRIFRRTVLSVLVIGPIDAPPPTLREIEPMRATCIDIFAGALAG